MKKDFTIQVPDELWVDCWKNNNTMTWTYDGPEKLYRKIGHNDFIMDWNSEPFESMLGDEHIEEVDANELTSIAYFLVDTKNPSPPEHIFEDEINVDGSIYKKILNPRLQEIFYIDYNRTDKFKLLPIYKSTEIPATQEVKKKLEYIKRYTDIFEFDELTNSLITKFENESKEFLEKMKTVYPWKFDKEINVKRPKIPVALVEKFQSLPTNFEGVSNE